MLLQTNREKKLIVGLGNPGKQYIHTPHNMGFAVLDELARRLDLRFRRSLRFNAWLAGCRIAGREATLAKPNAYMNTSGTVVAALARRKGFTAEDILLVTDDVNLPEGQLRIRFSGSSGGHNGLQSVIDHLGCADFARLRLGVGQARDGSNLVEHVLTPIPVSVRGRMEKMTALAAEAVVFFLEKGIAEAMNKFNKSNQEEVA